MAILILIKQITTTYDSPNVAYHCGNTYPWHYSSAVDLENGAVPLDCFVKNDTCTADNYYRGRFTLSYDEYSVTGYDQLGYIDSGASSGASENGFYGRFIVILHCDLLMLQNVLCSVYDSRRVKCV